MTLHALLLNSQLISFPCQSDLQCFVTKYTLHQLSIKLQPRNGSIVKTAMFNLCYIFIKTKKISDFTGPHIKIIWNNIFYVIKLVPDNLTEPGNQFNLINNCGSLMCCRPHQNYLITYW